MRVVLSLAAAAVLAGTPALSKERGKVPQLVGTWSGTTSAIVAGKGGHWPNSTGTFVEPERFERPITLTIEGQDGRRFWGSTKIEGGAPAEPFIGSIDTSNRNFVIADTDGAFAGKIKGSTLAYCYVQVPGPNNPAAVAACLEVKRTSGK